jgi:hypothetical protein
MYDSDTATDFAENPGFTRKLLSGETARAFGTASGSYEVAHRGSSQKLLFLGYSAQSASSAKSGAVQIVDAGAGLFEEGERFLNHLPNAPGERYPYERPRPDKLEGDSRRALIAA